MTVDEILASGEYVDRRGREWFVVGQDSDLGPAWVYNEEPFGAQALIGTHHLRLLIECDMHRDECPGLNGCIRHPRPHVLLDWEDTGKFLVYEPNKVFFHWIFDTHAEAMKAAYGLAVSSD